VILPRTVKTVVLAVTLAPFLAFFLLGAFMLAVSLGLWEYSNSLIDARLNALAWNLALMLGAGFGALHLSLTIFYTWHISTNRRMPLPLRIFAIPAVILAPLLSMPVYCVLCILPEVRSTPSAPIGDTELPNHPSKTPVG
jgi:hypothetical protein